MPLYMDFHKIDKVTVEDVKSAHMADKAIQQKYGVRYHQFWVNQEAGAVFCLIEGPDAATCEMVHQMAHGNIACALTEVEPGLYEKMMGTGHKIDQGHVLHPDGTVDLGYRTIMVTAITGITKATDSKQLLQLLQPNWARTIVFDSINSYKGRELDWENDDSIIGVFDDTDKAIECSLNMQQQLINEKTKMPNIIFRTGISVSQPVTENGDFFQQAIRLAHQLCMIAAPGQILISSMSAKLCSNDALLKHRGSLKLLNIREEDFISKLVNATEKRLGDEAFDLDTLSADICVSRPQLYRKIVSLTGLSPNGFVRDMRMQKALIMLKQQQLNITEIAYQTGFGSPSYFSKCFTDKFGCPPSVFLKFSS